MGAATDNCADSGEDLAAIKLTTTTRFASPHNATTDNLIRDAMIDLMEFCSTRGSTP